MRMRMIGYSMLFCAALTMLTASAVAQKAKKPDAGAMKVVGDRPADWERQASEAAMATYAKALEAKKAEADEILAALAARKTELAPELAKANEEKGFVLFARPWQEFIPRHAAPTAEQAALKGLTVELAGDQWAPIQLGVWAMRDLKEVSVSVGELVGPGGQRLTGVRVLYGMNLLSPSQKKSVEAPDDDVIAGATITTVGYVNNPWLLADLAAVDVPAGSAQAVWLDVYAPASAAAGEYAGEAVISVAGKAAARVPVKVTVLPFVLDPAKEWARGPFASRFLDRATLLQLREHGFNAMTSWQGGYTLKIKDGKATADFSEYVKYLKLMDDCGFVGPHAIFIGGSDPKLQNTILEHLGRKTITDARGKKDMAAAAAAFAKSDLSPPFGDLLVQVMKQFHEQTKAVGHPDAALCLLDEPDHKPHPQRRDWYLKMYAMAEKGAPEVPTYGTFYHAGDEDRLSHHHRIWTTNRPAKKIAEASHKAGARLHTYGVGGHYDVPATEFRFLLGMVPYVFQAEGSYYWAQYWQDGDPLDPFSVKGKSTASVQTSNGPLPTVCLKAMRAAINDRRYLVTLEKLIAQAKASEKPAAQAEAAAAQKFLDSFRVPMYDSMTIVGRKADFHGAKVEAVTADGARHPVATAGAPGWDFCEMINRETARHIVALQEKMK